MALFSCLTTYQVLKYMMSYDSNSFIEEYIKPSVTAEVAENMLTFNHYKMAVPYTQS